MCNDLHYSSVCVQVLQSAISCIVNKCARCSRSAKGRYLLVAVATGFLICVLSVKIIVFLRFMNVVIYR